MSEWVVVRNKGMDARDGDGIAPQGKDAQCFLGGSQKQSTITRGLFPFFHYVTAQAKMEWLSLFPHSHTENPSQLSLNLVRL